MAMLLLDTNARVWWLQDAPSLSPGARDAIADADNEIFVSAASAMEVVTKHRLGRLPEAAALAQDFGAIVRIEGFVPLSISLGHAALAGSLRIAHKDPFDRFLIAQALAEGIPLVSNEATFDEFGVVRIW